MTQQSLFTDIDETTDDKLYFEKFFRNRGFSLIAGIDEAGRGPLAGPVVAAALLLPEGVRLDGVNDSKMLSEAKRELFFDQIMAKASSVGVGIVDNEEIDKINILQATRKAMLKAVLNLSVVPDILLIDGITKIESSIEQITIKKGDSRSLSIAAASIIAKVTRDKMMLEYDKLYPEYLFASHKGYGTKVHRKAIENQGVTPIHRRSFAGVKEYCR